MIKTGYNHNPGIIFLRLIMMRQTRVFQKADFIIYSFSPVDEKVKLMLPVQRFGFLKYPSLPEIVLAVLSDFFIRIILNPNHKLYKYLTGRIHTKPVKVKQKRENNIRYLRYWNL